MTLQTRKYIASVAGVLAAAVSLTPWYHGWHRSQYASETANTIMVGVGLVGIAMSFLYRRNQPVMDVALRVVGWAVLTYIPALVLSFAFIEAEDRRWNVFAFFLLMFYVPFYYGAGVLVGLFLPSRVK